MKRFDQAVLFAAASLVLGLCQAQAHITLETTQAQPGAAYRGVLRVGHGCQGTATTAIKVQIPEGLINVKPMPKAGWKLETTRGNYVAAYDLYGSKLTEGVKEIIWSGGNLPDEFYDEFVFASSVGKEVGAEKPLYLPVIQTCEKGAQNWVEIPAPGQDARLLKQPAPAIRLMAANAPPAEIRLGDLLITQPWARATPASAPVAGGYIRVQNQGSAPDRLLSGTTEIAGSVEFHEMKTEDGVMQMRPLPQGLALAPGQTVELKPGGLHIMFTGLKRQLKPGDSFRVTLVFERAGTIALDFRVEGIGAQGPGAGGDEHAGH